MWVWKILFLSRRFRMILKIDFKISDIYYLDPELNMTQFITSKTQIHQLQTKIGNNVICYPFNTNDDSIIATLTQYEGDMAHPTNDGHIIFKKDGVFYKFVKPADSFFLNTISATDAALTTKENIERTRNTRNLKCLLGYEPEDIDTMSFEILTEPRTFNKKSKIFMLTQKDSGQYLDFVGYSKTGGHIVNYSTRTMKQVLHCGDRVSDRGRPTDPTVFIHAMSINHTVTDGVDFTIGGVGYSSTPLMNATFMHQKPSMCCYDSSNNTTYIIPFKQTRAILGDQNTTLISGVVEMINEREMRITPVTLVPNLNRDGSAKKYNTNDLPTCDIVSRAFIEAKTLQEQISSDAGDSGGGAPAPISVSKSSVSTDSDGESVEGLMKVVQFATVNNTNLFEIESSVVDYTGNIVDRNNKFNPGIFGISKPDVYNGRVIPADIHINNFNDAITNANLIVLHFNEENMKEFTEQARANITQKITCIVILSVDLSNHDTVIDTMEKMKLSCTHFANQFSIILAKCYKTNKYYWVRGVRWFHERIYNFGEEFIDLDKTIMEASLNKTPYPIIDNSSKISYKKELMSFDTVRDLITKQSYEEMIENQDFMVEALIQMSVVVNNNEFKKFKMECVKFLKNSQETHSKKDKTTLAQMTRKQFAGDDSVELKKSIDEIKSKIRKERACFAMKKITLGC